jgi:hypothetical protein
VVVAELPIGTYVNTPSTNFLQGSETQRCDIQVLHDQQGEAPVVETSAPNGCQIGKNTEVVHVRRPGLDVQITCDLAYCPENIELLWVQGRDLMPGVSIEAGDKKVQVAQDLGAVHKPIDVARVHSLEATPRACPFTGFRAQPSTRFTHLEPIFIYFHLVRRTGPDTRGLIHHEVMGTAGYTNSSILILSVGIGFQLES